MLCSHIVDIYNTVVHMNKVIIIGLLSLIFAPTSTVAETITVTATSRLKEAIDNFVLGTGKTADCITDKSTGLMWVKSPSSKLYSWEAANTKDSTSGGAIPSVKCGYKDWRLPYANELLVLVGIWSELGFSNVQSNRYWTAAAPNTYGTWLVDFGNNPPRSHDHYVWPVRSIK